MSMSSRIKDFCASMVYRPYFADARDCFAAAAAGYLFMNGWRWMEASEARNECMERIKALEHKRQTLDEIAKEYRDKVKAVNSDKWKLAVGQQKR